LGVGEAHRDVDRDSWDTGVEGDGEEYRQGERGTMELERTERAQSQGCRFTICECLVWWAKVAKGDPEVY